MNIKNFLLFILSIIFSANIISCDSVRDKMVKERLTQLNVSNDDEIADESLNKIINALENRNNDEIKNIFSANVLEEAVDIDNGINYLMDFYKGKLRSKDDGTVQTSELSENGIKKTRLKCKYIVNTNKETYLVFFIYHKMDT